VPHAPGQLAIYPIVRLAARGWSVRAYRERLQAGMVQVLARLGLAPQVRPGSPALWGRSGVLATCGLEVQDGVACHGAFLNVDSAAAWLRRVDVVPRDAAAPGARRWMSSLVCERGRPLRMAAVRAEVVAAFVHALDCPRYHPHTGHPFLTSPPPPGSESLRRAS
jgi:lipoyl(octanoyl) transferase